MSQVWLFCVQGLIWALICQCLQTWLDHIALCADHFSSCCGLTLCEVLSAVLRLEKQGRRAGGGRQIGGGRMVNLQDWAKMLTLIDQKHVKVGCLLVLTGFNWIRLFVHAFFSVSLWMCEIGTWVSEHHPSLMRSNDTLGSSTVLQHTAAI